MKALLIFGPSGSGKSTLAKKYLDENPNTVHVERDRIRFDMLKLGDRTQYKINPATEFIVDTYWKNYVFQAAMHGLDVLISDTLCKVNDRNNVRKLLEHLGYTVHMETPDVTLQQCIERNAKRGVLCVGEEVILRQWSQLNGEKR